MTPDLSPDRIDRLRDAFLSAEYHADGVMNLLGPQAHAALGRGEPQPALRATADTGPLGTLIRLFLLGEAESTAAVATALHPLDMEEAKAAGLLVEEGRTVRAGLDVRPHAAAEQSWWVISDLDSDLRPSSSPVRTDHVLGVGHASLSLVRATSRRPVGSVLDLGTGCGVQALHASTHARRITATDVSKRALALAAATLRLNRIDAELLQGDWFDPVADRRFDQVVCNPPFVVGPARSDFVYRDSGLDGDDASAMVVGHLPAFLHEGGTGQLLASWIHRRGEDWRERVAGWLPASGVDAWFVQRDIADPALYVGTWLRDAGYDPRSPSGRQKADEWLDWFETHDVEGVGFGFVALRRTESAHGEVVCEDLRHAFDDPLGPETDGWLRRVEWLRDHSSTEALLGSRLVTTSSTVLEQVSSLEETGWAEFVNRLHRTDGPGWQHEIDELGLRLIAGCQGALPVGDLVELLATAHGEDTEELTRAAVPMLRELVRHGMLLPAEWAETER
ncbi:methyltransferase family protein [Halopolyspora algeriensis]|uniref:Methyltransferase family protein n=1 Tax=Halopolyspora algeriensis TaxID=1500506 RepID=A0A368VQU9_9ACTN|nr:methyltransferase [Halopolyspora algeriensis]RCW43998.1 methyltransferase family protein [Halopolyspora algeriensis]TQM53499.1 methyltransferase family protein [Halopolyspora algeriensis]